MGFRWVNLHPYSAVNELFLCIAIRFSRASLPAAGGSGGAALPADLAAARESIYALVDIHGADGAARAGADDRPGQEGGGKNGLHWSYAMMAGGCKLTLA